MLTQIKNHSYYPILDNGIGLFLNPYINDGIGHQHHQHYHSESYSTSVTNTNYLQNQGSHLDTIIETEAKVSPKPPFIKRILLVDDDPDVTLTFKAGLDGRYYGDRKRFDVYTYNNPILVVKEFKPQILNITFRYIYPAGFIVNLLD